MLDWATPIVGLLGLLVGNLLNRSMEYRKWWRAERHRACTQLLDAGQDALTAAAFQQAAAVSIPLALEDPFEQLAELLSSRPQKFIFRPLAWIASRALVRAMNPGANAKDVDKTLAGVLESVTARVEPPMVDFLADRLGAGKSGRLAQLREVSHRLSLATESVELICSRHVAEAGRSLTSAAIALFADGADGTEPWEERLEAYNKARRMFVQAARRDLALDRRLRVI